MITKWLKTAVIGTAAVALLGGLVFGKDVVSYVRSSARSVRAMAKDAVPIEFELMRARDLLEDIIPEMHANIRLIAQEEVEVASLKGEIAEHQENLDAERNRIRTLRASLETARPEITFANRTYTRDDIRADLAARFERLTESELVLASKVKLLSSREQSLQAAMDLLARTRDQKRLLENKIEALAAQHRVVKAASVGSQIHVDDSKLAQTEELIAQIQRRLDVAERVLAHESRFVQAIPVDAVAEEDLVAQVDQYFEDRLNPAEATDAVEVAQGQQD
jgi:uncharacterized coiled-coil protein SlyX